MNVNMIESGAWLPRASQFVRSLTLVDLLVAFGRGGRLLPPKYPVLQASQTFPPPRPAAVGSLAAGATALVVVAGADDWPNAGFAARVAAHIRSTLAPLLHVARAANIPIIHLPNSHHLAPACVPLPREHVCNSTTAFTQVLADYTINHLIYVGYAANREVMWGDGGMARYYSDARYVKATVPAVTWVPPAVFDPSVLKYVSVERARGAENEWKVDIRGIEGEQKRIIFLQFLENEDFG